MGVPKRKPSRARRGSRRAHDFLVPPQTIACTNCGEPRLPHRICPNCKSYKGRIIIQKEQ